MAPRQLHQHRRPDARVEAAHDDDALLALVAEVARTAAADPSERVRLPERVSMAQFNRVKRAVDRQRGLDPETDADRIPSAEAIHQRFNRGAARKYTWAEIVAAAVAGSPTMWLTVARSEPHTPVPFSHVEFGLKRVAHELSVDVLDRAQYRTTRDRLVDADERLHGDDAVLARVLPTLNQIDGQYGWTESVRRSGLTAHVARPSVVPKGQRPWHRPPTGLPMEEAVALFAALNGEWPARMQLRAFARDSRFSLAEVKPFDPRTLNTKARALLIEHGATAPAGSVRRPRRRGTELTYRYPVNGIPGLTLHGSARPSTAAGTYRGKRESEWREFCVISLRIWLADDRAGGTSREKYRQWARTRPWVNPKAFAAHWGFTALKRDAADANAAARRENGKPVPKEVVRRGLSLATELAQGAPSAPEQPRPPFAELLRAVLAGPHAAGRVPPTR